METFCIFKIRERDKLLLLPSLIKSCAFFHLREDTLELHYYKRYPRYFYCMLARIVRQSRFAALGTDCINSY